MIRTFRALTRVSPGFTDPATVETVRLSIPEAEVRDPESVVRMQQAIQEKRAPFPASLSAAMTTFLPMSGANSSDILFARDRNYAEGELPPVSPLQLRFTRTVPCSGNSVHCRPRLYLDGQLPETSSAIISEILRASIGGVLPTLWANSQARSQRRLARNRRGSGRYS